MEYKFTTSFPIDDCISKLKSSTEKHATFGQFLQYASSNYPSSGKPEIKIHGNQFRLFIKFEKLINRNSFHTFFYGELSPSENGTLIKGKFKMHPFVRALMAMWFSGATIIGGIIFIVSLLELLNLRAFVGGTYKGNPIYGVVIVPVFIGLGYGLVRFGKSLSKKEEEYLIEFLKNTLNINEITSTSN